MVRMTITLDLVPFVALTSEQYAELCARHPELRIERTAKGEIIVLPPAGGETGHRNTLLTYRLQAWAESHGGWVFDSSTGFTLPNGAQRSPDACRILDARWQALTPEERAGFAPICPDLVVELMSPSDRRSAVQAKMQEYIDNGARLGWLLDPIKRQVEIWRPEKPVESRDAPVRLSGEFVLPGLELSLSGIL